MPSPAAKCRPGTTTCCVSKRKAVPRLQNAARGWRERFLSCKTQHEGGRGWFLGCKTQLGDRGRDVAPSRAGGHERRCTTRNTWRPHSEPLTAKTAGSQSGNLNCGDAARYNAHKLERRARGACAMQAERRRNLASTRRPDADNAAGGRTL